MAKSRRSRRSQKSIQVVTTPPPEQTESTPALAQKPSQPDIFKEVNFGREYYYVYQELRNIGVVAVVMFVVMTGLAYLV